MTNDKLNPKIIKYKKEIGWLLEEKYKVEGSVIPDLIGDLSFEGWIPAFAVMTGEELDLVKKDIQRILDGEPVDYVIGFKEFLNCKIDLSLKPLIPRPETEYWVNNIITDYKLSVCAGRKITNSKILDLCCGSGCIGISLLKNLQNCSVTFVDLSESALEQTKINLKINELQDTNYKLFNSNLFEKLKGQKFDFIFINPPYVKQKDINGSLVYEPVIALDGFGVDGLNIIYKILENFSTYLNPGGKLFMEFGFGQKMEIEKFLKLQIADYKLQIKNYEFKKDQFGKFRTLIIQL